MRLAKTAQDSLEWQTINNVVIVAQSASTFHSLLMSDAILSDTSELMHNFGILIANSVKVPLKIWILHVKKCSYIKSFASSWEDFCNMVWIWDDSSVALEDMDYNEPEMHLCALQEDWMPDPTLNKPQLAVHPTALTIQYDGVCRVGWWVGGVGGWGG